MFVVEPEDMNEKDIILDDPEVSISATITSPIVKSHEGENVKPLISTVTLYYPGAKDLKELYVISYKLM